MAAGADALSGEHDFRAFCRRAPGTAPDDPIVRRVLDARWSRTPCGPGGLGAGARLLRFDITATSFCHQMVRSVVGALVEVGRGRRRAAGRHLDAHAPATAPRAATMAPPHGLCLLAVDYGDADRPLARRRTADRGLLPGAWQAPAAEHLVCSGPS